MAESEQAVEASLEARIAEQFDRSVEDEETPEPEMLEATPEEEEILAEDESQETDQDEASEDDIEIEFEGYKIPLPKDVATKFKEAQLRHEDYTRKTQEVAEQRKKLDIAQNRINQAQADQEFLESVQPDMQQIQVLDAYVKQYDELNWGELSTDEFVRHKHQQDTYARQRDQLIEALKGKQAGWLQERQKTHQQFLAQGEEYLRKAIPSWTDDKGPLKDYLGSRYTQEEIGLLSKYPVLLEDMWQSMQYRTLKSTKASAVKTAKQAPTVTPKSSKPMTQERKDFLKHRKRIKAAKTEGDKANVIMDRLTQMYGG